MTSNSLSPKILRMKDTDIAGNIEWFSYEDEYYYNSGAPEEKKGAR
jgi:hypothetical protein